MSLNRTPHSLMTDVFSALELHLGKEQAIWALGQGSHESAHYSSRLAMEALNFWGIKATPSWHGGVWSANTHEVIKGKTITVKAGFRLYPTVLAGVSDYLSLLERLYGNPLHQKSLNVFLNSLQGKWATDPHYSPGVHRSIDAVRLLIK